MQTTVFHSIAISQIFPRSVIKQCEHNYAYTAGRDYSQIGTLTFLKFSTTRFSHLIRYCKAETTASTKQKLGSTGSFVQLVYNVRYCEVQSFQFEPVYFLYISFLRKE